MWPALIPVLGNLMDKLFPDPTAAAAAKLEIMKMAQAGDLAALDAEVRIASGQIEVNKVEAASSSLFIAGWRPFIGWVCGMAFAFKFILGPMLMFVAATMGHPVVLPVLDFTEMSSILVAMLGIGGLRTVEKLKGAATGKG